MIPILIGLTGLENVKTTEQGGAQMGQAQYELGKLMSSANVICFL